MYEGQLITFRLADSDVLVAKALKDIDLVLEDETKIMLKDKASDKVIGQLAQVIGIDLEEFINIMTTKQE